jgi:NADH-quinone oxidoreductase subunit K
MIPLTNYLILSAVLFGLGVIGVVISRNVITILMSIELMLNAANLALISFARWHGDPGAHVFVFIIFVVAAAEAAVGLSLVIAIFRRKRTVDVDELNILKG